MANYIEKAVELGLDPEMAIEKELEERIVNHLTQNNAEMMQVVRMYHMQEVDSIRQYMMRVLGGYINDARMLNASFHSALRDLNINWNDLLKPVKRVERKESAIMRRAV
jgi:hypothetical protein